MSKKENADPLYETIMNDPIYTATNESEIELLLRHPKKLPFSYEVIQEINSNHPETPEKNRLTDGKAASPRNDSLQVNDNMTVILDLNSKQDVGVISFIPFYRKSHFAVEKADYFMSNNKSDWEPIGTVKRDTKKLPVSDSPELFSLILQRSILMRYVKIEVTMEKSSRLILAGEIVVLANRTDLTSAIPITKKASFKTTEPPRPLHIKQTLDEVLLKSKVKFLYGTYITELLTDAKGDIRGAVITSRSGRQAVTAKSVIDARTDYKELLESNKENELLNIEYVVIGGREIPFEKGKYTLLQSGICETMNKPYRTHWPNQAKTEGGEFPIFRYTFEIKREDAEKAFGGDLSKLGEIETEIRLATYHKDQQFTSDRITLLPGSNRSNSLKLGNCFGKYSIRQGRELGREAGKSAAQKETVSANSLRVTTFEPEKIEKPDKTISGDVRELLNGIRSYEKPLGFIHEHGLKIPIAASYDVVVVGGGTTGAPAGIAAARAGAETLVVEFLHDMGGVGTLGAIAGYYWGNKVGFTDEITEGKRSWNIVQKAQTWRTKLREAGGDVWFGVLGAGAVVDLKPDAEGRTMVKGVLLATEFGPKIVLAKVVIDTTGNGDIAMTAGAEMRYVTENEITVQGAGLAPRYLGGRYMNNDYTYIDDTDPIDATHVFVYGKGKFPTAFDQGKILNTRERRRIVGEFTFTPLDQINLRTYPDSIARSFSNFDTHGYTIEPYLEIYHPKKVGIYAYYPYRSSIPKGLDGILVGALATSCHRDALPLIRMQADLQNQGYGLGYAAATAVKDGVAVRNVDIRKIQKHLVEIGNLPESVLTETDNYGESKAKLAEAVKTIPNDYEGAALVMWYPEESKPLLRKAYHEAINVEAKFAYAKILAAYGDSTGEAALLEALQNFENWDEGWNFKGMSQFGMASSPLDQIIMMLGRIRSKAAIPLITERLAKLKQEDDFSHHRACILALEWIGEPSGASAISLHLRKPKMTGYVHDSIATAEKRDREDLKVALGEKSRRDSLLELGAARALYRLGDADGLGKQILEAYSKDMRGHFARHATEILKK
ncbi:MAG: FAD-dependent oxidoreductase [Planctomycetaceae bacterium]|nr:FAD-dependent oxidoreductase [Planctomycetaceae bacterium]